MRKVLIPTDFSENAWNAIRYALEIFKNEISEFYIMHAYQDEIYKDEDKMSRLNLNETIQRVANKSQLALQAILKDIQKISPNPKHAYNIISSNNLLLDEADKIVNEKNIDLVVMGTRGYTNDRKLTFGSHTLQVLKYVQCPVLVIPENYRFKEPKQILFPTNFMIPNKRRELKLLCELTASFKGKIDVLYVSNIEKMSMRQEDNKAFIKEELCKNAINFRTVNSKDVLNVIYQYIDDFSVDLLVMVNTRHSFLENILFKSTIDDLTLNVNIPFLALQNTTRY